MHIASESDLVSAALALGAANAGGPLARAEHKLVATVAPASTFDASELAEAIRAGGDPLGDAFVALRSPLVRRAAGAFYTPPEIVTPMVAWAMERDPTRFVDPGCGSGRFALAALAANPEIEILGVDLDPLATLLCRANLATVGATSARVVCADFLTARLPEHRGRTAWVGNPPYLRHHDLSAGDKRWAAQAAKRLGYTVSGLAGLHALFFLATALRAQPADVGCFVTSAEWLDVGYGAIVRGLLTNGLGGTSLDLIDPRAVPFADVMTTALVTSFVTGRAPATMTIRLVREPEDLRLGAGEVVEVKTMSAATRWSPLFRGSALAVGETLGDLARVHRGLATGANDFFVMTKAEANKRGLSEWAQPAITAAAEIMGSGGVIHDAPERKVIISMPPDLDRKAHRQADVYLREGERLGVHKTYLCSHRKPWWRLAPAFPPIVASYMARQAPGFARNPDSLALLNIAHGIFPANGVDPDALVTRLNVARGTFAGSGRTYHGGLEKFEPREMEALPIPDARLPEGS